MKLLVTGGLGFIGSNFVRHALKQPEVEKLLVIDKFTYAAQADHSEDLLKSEKFVMFPGDITETGSVFQALKMMQPTHVLHLAAQTHVDRSIKDPTTFFKTNTLGTLSLLDMLRQYSSLTHFLHVSTDEVYGPVGSPFDKCSERNGPLNPVSPYAASKASAEMVCNSYSLTFEVPITIVRPTNNYGPFQNPEKFIPKTIVNALSNLPIPIYGSGQQIRDWMFVEDHCVALWEILNSNYAGGVFNIGAQNHINNLDLANKILNLIPESKSKIVHVEDRLAHDFCYSVTTSLANLVLNWSPTTDFETGLKKTIQWYRENYNQIS